MQGLEIDSDAFDLSDWDQRLAPPAAKAAVQTLSLVVISPEQAGDWTATGGTGHGVTPVLRVL